MQRNPALIPLSREHLPALILAYRLRHGRSSNPAHPWPSEPTAQRSAALTFIHGDLARHFAAEEAVLLPLKVYLSDPGPSDRVWAEHQAFWRQVQAIEQADPEALPPLLQALGELLEAHVRFEERVWFEQLQSELTPVQLQTVMVALAEQLPPGNDCQL
jgi:iron-sulfur cluster repair protein YtfE (RIC family)